MNARMAKRLRKLAKLEMSSNAETVERELVLARVRGHDRVVNEPMSVRSFYLQLKGAYSDFKHGVRKTQQSAEE